MIPSWNYLHTATMSTPKVSYINGTWTAAARAELDRFVTASKVAGAVLSLAKKDDVAEGARWLYAAYSGERRQADASRARRPWRPAVVLAGRSDHRRLELERRQGARRCRHRSRRARLPTRAAARCGLGRGLTALLPSDSGIRFTIRARRTPRRHRQCQRNRYEQGTLRQRPRHPQVRYRRRVRRQSFSFRRRLQHAAAGARHRVLLGRRVGA